MKCAMPEVLNGSALLLDYNLFSSHSAPPAATPVSAALPKNSPRARPEQDVFTWRHYIALGCDADHGVARDAADCKRGTCARSASRHMQRTAAVGGLRRARLEQHLRRAARAYPQPMKASAPGPFGRDYYRRYYFDQRTAVVTRNEMQARAALIAAFTRHADLPVRRILEAGCGTGLLRSALLRLLPRASYCGLESSAYLCQRYGWTHGRIEQLRVRTPFDLVICYDVLQYLDERAARRALANFARLCRGVLYFSALTRYDFTHNCDRSRTDPDVHLRSARWYRSLLGRQFRELGLGFWLRRGAPLTLWELESG
jgi:SAM-dependent methyltransferase